MAYYNLAYFLKNYINENTVIVCIGTDKCIGDSLGPLVGTLLNDSLIPIPIYGTLASPIHALNIDKKLIEIKKTHPNALIIGVDACLGDINSIGELHARDYPLHPGKGVGKTLPDVGDASIIGIVDSSNSTEIFTNRTIRLSLVMDMSKSIVKGILHAYSLSNINKISTNA